MNPAATDNQAIQPTPEYKIFQIFFDATEFFRPGLFLLLRLLQSGDEGFITLKKQAMREGLGPLESKDRAIAWKV